MNCWDDSTATLWYRRRGMNARHLGMLADVSE